MPGDYTLAPKQPRRLTTRQLSAIDMVSETELANREKINLISYAVVMQLPLTQTAEMQTAVSPHRKMKESICQNVIGEGKASPTRQSKTISF